MVLPRWLARTNRRFTNRLLGRIPQRVSPFVTLHHVGRKSGRPYAVPLAGFATATEILLIPTYGPGGDWVQNVIAAGAFSVQRRGELLSFRDAHLVDRTTAWPYLPRFVRLAMRALRVHWFVLADRA